MYKENFGVMKELFAYNGEYFILNDNKPFAYGVFSRGGAKTGDIYVCRARETERSIGAVFFDIGDKRTAFFPSTKYSTGSYQLMQIKTEAHDGKGAELTDEISFTGKYCVVTFSENAENRIVFSRKLKNPGIKAAVNEHILLEKAGKYGLCVKVRSIFSHGDEPELASEIAAFREAFISLTAERSDCVKKLREVSFREYLNRKYRIAEFDSYHFEHPLDFYSEYSKVRRLCESRIYLKSGGWITFEKTEAMFVIDVNSGSSKKNALDTNLEALETIHEAVRIKNTGGIIIIDFINMSREEEKILSDRFGEYCAEDYTFFKPLGFTKLGLFEAERKRI